MSRLGGFSVCFGMHDFAATEDSVWPNKPGLTILFSF